MEELGRIFLAFVPETWIGVDVRKQIGPMLHERGFCRALIVTDKAVREHGLLEDVEKSLQACALPFGVFGGSLPNGPTEVVEECAEVARKEAADVLIAVGGGSSIDIAKAASALVTNEGDIYELIGRDRIKTPALFKVAIPTTAGTGSEWSTSAIITDARDALKKPIFSRFMCCDLVLLDPVLTMELPPRQTAETGIDALTHAIEAYGAWKSTVISDMYAEKAIELVGRNLRTAYAKGRKHIESRYNMLLAAALAMAAHTSSSAGLIHAMNYPLTAKAHVSHGTALALLLPHVIEFNLVACPERYGRIAQLLGERIEGLAPMEAARRASAAVRGLCRDLGMPERLTEIGFQASDIAPALEFLFAFQGYGLENNPRDATRDDLRRIYEAAL